MKSSLTVTEWQRAQFPLCQINGISNNTVANSKLSDYKSKLLPLQLVTWGSWKFLFAFSVYTIWIHRAGLCLHSLWILLLILASVALQNNLLPTLPKVDSESIFLVGVSHKVSNFGHRVWCHLHVMWHSHEKKLDFTYGDDEGYACKAKLCSLLPCQMN